MDRVKNLGRYQKAILILMIVMVTVFAVLYSVTVSREGFAYMDTILVPSQESESTVYSGKIHGQQTIFKVYADKGVTFQYGDKVYGPYTVKEDATAVPPGREYMKGIEVRCEEEMIFRGGSVQSGNFWILINEDGSANSIGFPAGTTGGDLYDDPMEPSVETILNLLTGPEMTHKGQWIIWFCGVFLCLVNTILILFADELFRKHLAFQIQNARCAEPSDWEIAGRYMSWTLLTACALVMFILGLQ